jgi:hypothetical protein
MARTLPSDPMGLLFEARRLLSLSRNGFAQAIGSSSRTMSRWNSGQAAPSPFNAREAAKLVYKLDRELALQLARAGHTDLVALGLEKAPKPAPPPPPTRPQASMAHLADSVVCAAAEAISITPRAVRPALLEAFRRARAVGLTLEEVEQALTSAVAAEGEGHGGD